MPARKRRKLGIFEMTKMGAQFWLKPLKGKKKP